MLPPDLTQILEKTLFAYIEILLELANKDKMLKKLNADNAKTPAGARLNFELKGSSDACKHSNFIALADKTEKLLEQCRQILKKQIVQALKIKIVVLKKKLNDFLYDSLRLICQTYCQDTDNNTEHADAVALHLIKTSHTMLLQYTNIDAGEFAAEFKSLHSISDSLVPLASFTLSSNNTNMETDNDTTDALNESPFFTARRHACQLQTTLSQKDHMPTPSTLHVQANLHNKRYHQLPASLLSPLLSPS